MAVRCQFPRKDWKHACLRISSLAFHRFVTDLEESLTWPLLQELRLTLGRGPEHVFSKFLGRVLPQANGEHASWVLSTTVPSQPVTPEIQDVRLT